MSNLSSGNESDNEYDVVVVGAGFAGIYALHRLREKLGLRVRVLEAGEDVGGTWFWNRYPGARCDTESYVYCYSFSPTLYQEWNWSGRYPKQQELQAYMSHVVDRFALRSDIQFNTRVNALEYDESTSRWQVTSEAGEVFEARYVITAVGLLSHTYVPKVTGLEKFKGQWCHTARWPSEGVDFKGKRIGIIGTGSTGVQAVPVISEQAEHLTVFQRSPQYAIPARHERVDRQKLDQIKKNYAEIWDQVHWSTGGFPFEHNGISALEVTDEERNALYEELWDEGGIKFLFGSYRDLLLDRRANDTAAEFLRAKIREEVEDPDVAEALVPSDHPFGSRRPIVHTNYYTTFNRKNVSLVDCRHFPIEAITEQGIQVANGHHDLDVIVFATGFDAVTGAYLAIDVKGRGGVTLSDKWVEGVQSFLGIGLNGFPNLFMVQGPGSTFGNQVVAIEHHIQWIAGCIEYTDRGGYQSVETTVEAECDWSDKMRAAAEETLVVHADSWWNGSNIPGKSRSALFYPGSYRYYRKTCDRIADEGYPGFEFRTAGGGVIAASAPMTERTVVAHEGA